MALALLGVHLADQAGENIMGWYANYVFPAGALLVGGVAASGFGLGSYFTGTKISGWGVWGVVALLLLGYWLAQFLEFRAIVAREADLQTVTFFEFYDFVTRSITFKSTHGSSRPTDPLGAWGYAFRLLEVIGFVGGGALVPLVLRRVPYCDSCARYKRTRQVALVPAAAAEKSINPKKDPAGAAAQSARMDVARQAGWQGIEAIYKAATGPTDGLALKAAIEAHGGLKRKRQVNKLQERIAVQLIYCRRCHDGLLRSLRLRGQGKKLEQIELSSAPADKLVVADFLRNR
jgi:hypothetical protein